MSFEKNYSFIDKALHHLAFSVPVLRNVLCDLENSLYKKELAAVESYHEVFVSGLPRSGTTLILELLYQTEEFHTFSYRHMPFIYSPLLWRKLSAPFSKSADKMERAHGDGMEVSFDSPEAFEEVIWLNHLEDKFVKSDRLVPLTLKNTTKKFAEHYKLTLKKLLIESNQDDQVRRYISKNNANCSRLSVLSKLFPKATILIPFREPLSHIGSLMKQHKLFTEMHSDDKFAQQYMRWLGHFDFGANFKPIDFDHWLDSLEQEPDYQSENFWLQYWTAAYQHMLNNRSDNILLVDYNKLLQSPAEYLATIAAKVALKQPEKLIDNAKKIRAPTSQAKSSDNVDANLLQKAQSLYAQLQQAAI